jgi:hypothetical protein
MDITAVIHIANNTARAMKAAKYSGNVIHVYI